jgi:diketogulonate reductase-like aldo/keto reductase
MQSQLPKLALGTWLMGGTKDPDPNNDDAGDIKVIKTAIESGISLIDTAQNYAGGKCEELVGQAIADLPRESIQILTKQNRLKLSYGEVIEGCHDSLGRLGVEYLDYFVCHAPNPDFDLADFFKASNQLYKAGLIKQVGVSNFGVKSLQIAIDTSDLPIALNQLSFSINDSDILTAGVYDFCLKHKVPIQAYRPLVNIKKEQDSYKLLQEIAMATKLTPHQVLIAYLNSYEGISFTTRASTAEHWQQIKDALEVTLEPSALKELKQVHMTKQGAFAHFLDM